MQGALSITEDEASVSICASIITGQIEREIVLPLTFTPGTASDADFTLEGLSLTFTEQNRTDCADVEVVNDDFYEGKEDFFANLSCDEVIVKCGISTSIISIKNDDGTVKIT